MSLARRAARKDDTQLAVVAAFLAEGCTVQAISSPGCPDLLVGYRSVNVLVEVKNPDGRGLKLNTLQREWHAAWRGAKPYVVHEPEQVPALLRDVLRDLGAPPATAGVDPEAAGLGRDGTWRRAQGG